MDEVDCDRKVRNKRRRSIRNLRRQSGIIVPLDLMMADDDSIRTHSDDHTDVVADEFGSTYIESHEPRKKERRRSSMLVRAPLLYPSMSEEDVRQVEKNNIDPLCQPPPDTDTAIDEHLSTPASRCPSIDNFRTESIIVPLTICDNRESSMYSPVHVEDTSGICCRQVDDVCGERILPSSAERELSPDGRDENTVITSSSLECNLDKAFIRDSLHGTPESEPLLEQDPSSFSPAYPCSPTAVIYSDCQNESYSDLLGHINQNMPSDLKQVEKVLGSSTKQAENVSGSSTAKTCFLESSASFEQLSDKENVDQNMSATSKSRDTQMTECDSTSPGFLSMCKTFAGKVVNAVKTSPSFLTNAFHGNTTSPLLDADSHCTNTSKHLETQLNYSTENVLSKITDEVVADRDLRARRKVDSMVEKVGDFERKVDSECFKRCQVDDAINPSKSVKKKRDHSLIFQTFNAISDELKKDRQCSDVERSNAVNTQVSNKLKDVKAGEEVEEKEIIHEKKELESFDNSCSDFQTTNVEHNEQLFTVDNEDAQMGIEVERKQSVNEQLDEGCGSEGIRKLSTLAHIANVINVETECNRNEGLNVERLVTDPVSRNTTCESAKSSSNKSGNITYESAKTSSNKSGNTTCISAESASNKSGNTTCESAKTSSNKSENTICENAKTSSNKSEVPNECEYYSDNDQFVDAFEINPDLVEENSLSDPYERNTLTDISETLSADICLDVDFVGDHMARQSNLVRMKQVEKCRKLPSVCFQVEKGSGDSILNNLVAGELQTNADNVTTMEKVSNKRSSKVKDGVTSRKTIKTVKKLDISKNVNSRKPQVKSQKNMKQDMGALDSNNAEVYNKISAVQTAENVKDGNLVGVVCEVQDQSEARENHIGNDVKTSAEALKTTETDNCSNNEQIKDGNCEMKQKSRKRRSSNFDKLIQESKLFNASDSFSGNSTNVGVRKNRRRSAEAATLKLASLARNSSEEHDVDDSIQEIASCSRRGPAECKVPAVSTESDPILHVDTFTSHCSNENVMDGKPGKKSKARCKPQCPSMLGTEDCGSAVNGEDSDVVPSSNVTRRKRRQSADAATLKIQMMEANFEFNSPEEEVAQLPKISRSKQQKLAANGSDEWLDKYYRNKTFVRPDAHRPWQTIIESPNGNIDVFGKKRLHRYTDYDKPAQMRLRRRHQRAMKNGWDPKKRRRNELKDEEVQEKLTNLWSELDSSE